MYEEKSKEHIAYKLEVEAWAIVIRCWGRNIRRRRAEEEETSRALAEARQVTKRQESDLTDAQKFLEDARSKGDAMAKYNDIYSKYEDLQDLRALHSNPKRYPKSS